MQNFTQGLNIDESGNIFTRLYYKPKGNYSLMSDQSVQIYGNFTENPWQNFIPCRYDHERNSFYHETHIKIGSQFKFLVGNDSHLVSKEFDVIQDNQGNQNNIFLPNIEFREFGCPKPADALKITFEDLIG